MNTSDVDNLNL